MSARFEYEVRVRAIVEARVYVYAETEDEALEEAQEMGFELGDVDELTGFIPVSAKLTAIQT